MDHSAWNRRTTPEEAHRRVGGRNRYNAMRKRKAEARRRAIAKWLDEQPPEVAFFGRGLPDLLAPILGVSRSQVWRDLQLILWGKQKADPKQGGDSG